MGKRRRSSRIEEKRVQEIKTNQNDDSCAICGDGGDLICCDGCPSTFHLICLGMQVLPEGDWLCAYCLCKFCGLVSMTPLLTCCQCQKKYHLPCMEKSEGQIADSNGFTFCGNNCKEIFYKLQGLIGPRNEIFSGVYWSFLERMNYGSSSTHNEISARETGNSKITLALELTEECFEPIIDRWTQVNMISSVVKSTWSSFNRINCSGFYTVVLEMDNIIISAASIRIHGDKLAEMPFIATRSVHRHKGNCCLLLAVIESALEYLGVEKLIIPSIKERSKKWIENYGFRPIRKSMKQELRTINILTFPNTIQLEKILISDDHEMGVGGDIELERNIPWFHGFDLNLPPPDEEEDGKNDDGKQCGGIFLVLDRNGGLAIRRIRVR